MLSKTVSSMAVFCLLLGCGKPTTEIVQDDVAVPEVAAAEAEVRAQGCTAERATQDSKAAFRIQCDTNKSMAEIKNLDLSIQKLFYVVYSVLETRKDLGSNQRLFYQAEAATALHFTSTQIPIMKAQSKQRLRNQT